MNSYLVIWAINIDAETPKEAAKQARGMQAAKGTLAKVFDIYDQETLKPLETVDLSNQLGKAQLELPQAIYTAPKVLNGKEVKQSE